jgi:hypothetical protein
MESDEEPDWIAIAQECQDLEDEKATAAAAAAAPTPAAAQAAGASSKHRRTNSIDDDEDVQVISPLFFSLPCFLCTRLPVDCSVSLYRLYQEYLEH